MNEESYNILSDNVVSLRAVEPADAEILYIIENDSSQWIDNGMMAPVSKEYMAVYASTYEPDPVKTCQLRLVIHLTGSDTVVGVIDIFKIDWKNLNAEIGIYIIKEYRSRGYALRSLRLIRRYIKEILGLYKVLARVSADNTDSEYLFRKAGFSLVGTLPGWIRKGNEYIDLKLFVSSD